MAPVEPLLFCLLPLVVAASFKDTYENFRGPKVDFYMRTTWDGQKIDHDPIKLTIGRVNATETVVFVQAPYFEGLPAKGYEDTESIQLYFLGADRESYLLIEVNPHSQYRVQLYRGPGNSIRDQLPLEYWSVITGKFWQGSLRIPEAYYPPGMSRFNAYAQHQHGDNTTYEALFPVPKDKPQQFPQIPLLEYFDYLPREILGPLRRPPSPYWNETTTDSLPGGVACAMVNVLLLALLVLLSSSR